MICPTVDDHRLNLKSCHTYENLDSLWEATCSKWCEENVQWQCLSMQSNIYCVSKRERENRYVSVNNDDGHSNTNILSLLFNGSV